MEVSLRYYGDEVLTKACRQVEETDEIAHYLDEMASIMDEKRALGIAANQVGLDLRMFIMRPRLSNGTLGDIIECINPKIIHRGKEFANLYEGCLSAPNLFFRVRDRAMIIDLEYQDRNGEIHQQRFEGINAVCAQHEYDHINGVFFFQKLERKNKRKALREWEKQSKKLGVNNAKDFASDDVSDL